MTSVNTELQYTPEFWARALALIDRPEHTCFKCRAQRSWKPYVGHVRIVLIKEDSEAQSRGRLEWACTTCVKDPPELSSSRRDRLTGWLFETW